MALMKYARATIVRPELSGREWSKVRTAAKAEAGVSENLIARASEIFGKTFDPKDYLLTHATIVASVDTFEPPNTKIGSFTEGGFKVHRKYGNFRVKLGSDKYINNNFDAWDRDVLLKSYKTFIGGHNFVEHVQVEDLSKGRIIDAVARDLGESVYVDILIATDRKHTDLVTAITSGKMSTLSMGCTVDGTQCTKCGHWAADETEMCPHVKFEKGNTFFDELGRQHRVAELCGHVTLEPTGGVQFIEGSWVGTPAFTGAVLRNILETPSPAMEAKMAAILASPPKEWVGPTKKATEQGFLAGWDEEAEPEADAEPEAPAEAEKPSKAPFEGVEEDLATHLTDRVLKKLKKDMDEAGQSAKLSPENPSSTNESVVKEARRIAYEGTMSFLCRTASNDAELMDKIATLNADYGIHIPVPLYRAALHLGSAEAYKDLPQFVRACRAVLGTQPTIAEARSLIVLGKIISRRGQARREDNYLAVATAKEMKT